MSEYEGTLQEDEQPSPSKWAVEAATELFYGHFDPEDEDDVTQREAMAETIDRAISSALAERAKVLGEVEGLLVEIRSGLHCPELDTPEKRQGLGCGVEDKDIVDRYEAAEYGYDDALERYQYSLRQAITPILTKLRSLKR